MKKKFSIGKNPRCWGNLFKTPLPKDRREGLRILLKTPVLGGGEIAVNLTRPDPNKPTNEIFTSLYNLNDQFPFFFVVKKFTRS